MVQRSINWCDVVSLMCAVVSGMLFAFVWHNYEQTVIEIQNIHNHIYGHLKDTGYNQWLQSLGARRVKISEEVKSFALKNNNNVQLEADFIKQEVPILCIILCKNRKNARAVKATWSQHCNNVMFFGPFLDKSLPIIKFPPSTSHTSFCYSFIKAWQKFAGKFKWLLIAHDDTYAIVENLRYYVAPLNSSGLFYFGRPVKQYAFKGIYNAADSGIVLSHGAAQAVSSAFHNQSVCDKSTIPDIGTVSRNFEVSLAVILSRHGCNAVDTRDLANKGRFHPFTPEKHLTPGLISIFNSFWRSSVFLSPEGRDCCSDHAITFTGLQPSTMYLTEYLLYHFAIFKSSGEGLGNKPPPYSSYKVRSELNDLIEVGTPHVHFMRVKKKTNQANTTKSSISKYLHDLFKNL